MPPMNLLLSLGRQHCARLSTPGNVFLRLEMEELTSELTVFILECTVFLLINSNGGGIFIHAFVWFLLVVYL